MFSLFLPPKTVSAVRLYGDEAVFDASASFLSLHYGGMQKSSGPKKLSGRLKKRRPKKRIRAIIRLLYGTKTRKADEILSDFSEEIIIAFSTAENRLCSFFISSLPWDAKNKKEETARLLPFFAWYGNILFAHKLYQIFYLLVVIYGLPICGESVDSHE